jgi:DnaK suppressor protein
MLPERAQFYRELLLQQRARIMNNTVDTLKHDLGLPPDEVADETDLANAVSERSWQLRLRDRERKLLKKIAVALSRIDADEYGYCEVCDDEIDERRLEARPVTTLCVECKEAAERTEVRHRPPEGKGYDAPFDFEGMETESDASSGEDLKPVPLSWLVSSEEM